MIIEQHALWGDETTPVYPATYTAYLAEKLPEADARPRPAVVICGGGGFTHVAPHEQSRTPWRSSSSAAASRPSCSIT